MKYVKLNGRHTLYRRGYKYAFVFKQYADKGPSEWTIAQLVREAEGYGWMVDNTFYGKPTTSCGRRPFYIGFHNKETAIIVKLKL